MASRRNIYPPGFRFHPTDEELVGYYLRRKVNGQVIDGDIISEVDLYRAEPWDLPDGAFLPDCYRYYFSPRDKKYVHGGRTSRATARGYWKATGKDRCIFEGPRNSQLIGMKKTLVFYLGRAPSGERTDWVMHEYRLEDNKGGPVNPINDTFVLCRVLNKKGDLKDAGPAVPSTSVARTPLPAEIHVNPDKVEDELGEWSWMVQYGLKEDLGTPLVQSGIHGSMNQAAGDIQRESQKSVMPKAVLPPTIDDPTFSVEEVDDLFNDSDVDPGFLQILEGIGEQQWTLPSKDQTQIPSGSAKFNSRTEISEVDSWITDGPVLDEETEPLQDSVTDEWLSTQQDSRRLLVQPMGQPLTTRGRTNGRPPGQYRGGSMLRMPAGPSGRVPTNQRSAIASLGLVQLVQRQQQELLQALANGSNQVGEVGLAINADPEVKEISREDVEKMQAGRKIQQRSRQSQRSFPVAPPDSIGVDSTSGALAMKSGEIDLPTYFESKLNDVSEDDVDMHFVDELNLNDQDASMTSARTRIYEHTAGRGVKASHGLTHVRSVSAMDERRRRGIPSLPSSLLGLARFLGPPGPANASEIPSSEVHLRGCASAPQLRKTAERFVEPGLSDWPAVEKIDNDEDTWEGLLPCGGGEEAVCRSEFRRRLMSASGGREDKAVDQFGNRRFYPPDHSNGTNALSWLIWIGAVVSLCAGVGSLIKLAVLYFRGS